MSTEGNFDKYIWGAIEYNDDILLKELLSGDNININITDKLGRTPLIYSSLQGFHEIVYILLKFGKNNININSKDNDGDTALISTCICGSLRTLNILLDRDDIDINITNNNNRTALVTSLLHMNGKLSKKLLERNDIDVNIMDNNGIAAIHRASDMSDSSLAEIILNRNDKILHINCVDNLSGCGALLWATMGGKFKVVEYMLKIPCIDVNIKTHCGYTALMWAIIKRHENLVELLLKHPNINIYITNINHHDVLHMANNSSDRIRELVKCKQNIEICKIITDIFTLSNIQFKNSIYQVTKYIKIYL